MNWFYFSAKHPRTGKQKTFHLYGERQELTEHVEKLGYRDVGCVPWVYWPGFRKK